MAGDAQASRLSLMHKLPELPHVPRPTPLLTQPSPASKSALLVFSPQMLGAENRNTSSLLPLEGGQPLLNPLGLQPQS